MAASPSCLAVAAFIIWRADPSALSLATATTLLVYGLLIGSDVTSTGLRQWGLEAAVMGPGLALFAFALTYVLHTFPNGRFVPRWSRLALLAEWLVLGVLMPSFHWTSETAVIKQSPFCLLAMLLSWGAALALFAGTAALSHRMPPAVSLSLACLLLAGADALALRWLKTKGAARFETT